MTRDITWLRFALLSRITLVPQGTGLNFRMMLLSVVTRRLALTVILPCFLRWQPSP